MELYVSHLIDKQGTLYGFSAVRRLRCYRASIYFKKAWGQYLSGRKLFEVENWRNQIFLFFRNIHKLSHPNHQEKHNSIRNTLYT